MHYLQKGEKGFLSRTTHFINLRSSRCNSSCESLHIGEKGMTSLPLVPEISEIKSRHTHTHTVSILVGYTRCNPFTNGLIDSRQNFTAKVHVGGSVTGYMVMHDFPTQVNQKCNQSPSQSTHCFPKLPKVLSLSFSLKLLYMLKKIMSTFADSLCEALHVGE